MSKHQEIGEKNKYGNECYKLHFTQFYDDEVIINFVQDKDDSSFFIYVSDLLNVEYDYLEAETIEIFVCSIFIYNSVFYKPFTKES